MVCGVLQVCLQLIPPWWPLREPLLLSGSLTSGGGENVPGIPGACTARNFTYLARGPWRFYCGHCGKWPRDIDSALFYSTECSWMTWHYINKNGINYIDKHEQSQPLSWRSQYKWHVSPDSKVHGANMGPNWVLSALDGSHVVPTNFVIWVVYPSGVLACAISA